MPYLQKKENKSKHFYKNAGILRNESYHLYVPNTWTDND